MNIRKNAEAIFLAAAIIGTFASYATASESAHFARVAAAPVAAKAVASTGAMQVVVIRGHRLSAAEKLALN